jgi:protein-tyrosine phosphatase
VLPMTTLRAVSLVPTGDGELLVSWELDAEPAEVRVTLGAGAEGHHHQLVATAPAGQREVRFADPGLHSPFASVAIVGQPGAVVIAERRVRFEGPLNFRDLGGYPTTPGVATRWGQLYRSDGLHRLTADDLARFESLGLRTVYDLRGDSELAETPDPVPAVNVPLLSEDRLRSPLAGLVSTRDGEAMLRDVYLGMLAGSARQFCRLFTGIAVDGMPALFHCQGGKDRTGLTSALVLLVLGVPRDVVLDDFELTSGYLEPSRDEGIAHLLGRGLSAEAAAGAFGAPRWAMAAALDELEQRYGGAERYLLDAGLDPAHLVTLRDRLVR